MSRPVIEINNLGKQYRLGQVGTTTIIEDFKRFTYKVRGKEDPFLKVGEENDRTQKGNSEYVWALQNIDFSVNEGEVLGIIGKNGAGKSTLLKILSRTTSPTVGEYKIKGRVASLLEVGTGFHPDLTGRENVFLNGAILGMTKKEIRSRFDEIVDFSGVERYIDTPVKRYSSGMYVRLAFAVAAHLNPEILIVDEVLAVGDIEFQQKCLGKMKDVAGNGKTVLFVSHNINAIRTLCSKGLFLSNGRVKDFGSIQHVTDSYLFEGLENRAIRQFATNEVVIKDFCEMRSVKIYKENDETTTEYDVTDPVNIEINYRVLSQKYTYTVHFYVKNSSGEVLFVGMDNKYSPFINNPQPVGLFRETIRIPGNFFNEGNYSIQALICTFPTLVESKFCVFDNALSFSVTDKNYENGTRGSWNREWPTSLVRPDFKWDIESVNV
jgi:lipopolysaccharide transport system ATP-binding protein